MRTRFVLAVLALSIGTTQAAENLKDFAFAVPIGGTGNDALYRVTVPQSVYEAVAFADLRDVRIFNAAGEVDPHAFRPLATLRQRSALVALPFFPLRGPSGTHPDDLEISVDKSIGALNLRVKSRQSADQQKVLLGYVIDASALKETLSGMRVDWNTRNDNYSAAVRVEASDDLKNWTTLIADAPLVTLTHSGQRLEHKTIEFSARKPKYLRLTWNDPTQALELSLVTGIPAEQVAPVERAWKEINAKLDGDTPGDYQIDLGGVFPVDRLSIRLPAENTIAPVEILSRASPSDAWLPVTRTVVYRLKQNRQELRSPDVTVRTSSHRYWLVRVDAKSGGFGNGALQVNAGWTPREIVFAARGEGPFRMAYGNGRASANALAIETLVPGWGGEKEPPLAIATTGAQVALAGASAARQQVNIHKLGLWFAMGSGVLMLAWMVWRLVRQMNQVDEPDA